MAGLFAAMNLRGQVDVPRSFIVVSNNAVAGPGTLTKTGAGILSLMAPSGNTFSNDIVVGVDGGTLRIGGNPFIASGTSRTGTTLPNMTSNNTVTIQRGGIFEIKDSSVTTFGYVANRLGSAGNRPKVSIDGGSLLYNGASITSAQMTQSVGVVTIASGATITANRGTLGTSVLMGDSFIMTPGAFVSFVGTGLGTAAIDVPKILFGTAPSMIGAGGADGSTTKSILKGARFASDLVTYGANGIRALAAAEYNSVALNDINGAGATENVRLTVGTAAIPPLTAPRTINSLVQNMSVNGTWAMGNTLTLTSGELLVNRALAISSGSLTAGAGGDDELHVIGIATTTMAGNIIDNGAGSVSLVKSGVGTLTLSAATDNTYSGGTVLNEGTIATSGTTANRRFFGTGPVKVDNAALTMTAIGSTANALGDDYMAVNAAQINLAALAYTADDTFNIGAGSVVSGTAVPLNTLDRGRNDSATTNITLAADAVIAHPALTTALNLGTGTIKNLGNDADLFYGLNTAQNNVNGSIEIGNGTAFKGISTPRVAGAWNLGTINVAAGTENIFLQGLTIPGTVPFVLSLGNNALVAGGPVINLADSGSVDAQVLNYVTLDDNLAVYGDAVNKLNFVVNSGALLTLNQTDSMGSGSGIATAEVKDGGTLALLNPAAINGDVTFEAGSRITANNAGGLIGAGALAFEADSLIELGHAVGFSGPQAAAATVEPGAIVRLNIGSFGSATDPLNNYFIGKSPTFELYGANATYWHVNPVAANTTILTLNRGEDGKGGMLVNRDLAWTPVAVPNGVVAIGPNGGVIASTINFLLTLAQPIALSSNELVIGSTEMIDRLMIAKLGPVTLNALPGYSTAAKGSKISIIPGVQLNNAVNSLPDLAEVAVDGIFNVAGSDTIGSLSGTGLVSLAANTLTVGRNDANSTFAGRVVATTGKFVKTGSGRLDLTGTNVFTTGTVRINDGGELALSGGGVLPNTGTAAFTLTDGGILHLDNSDVNLGNRLTGAAAGVTFNGGGFRFTGKDGEASSESLGAATFALGSSTIEIVNGEGEGSSSEIVFSALTAQPPGTVNFTAQNGILGSAGDNPRVKFTGLAAGLVGYGRVGDALAFYDTTYGIRAFTLGEGTEYDGTSAAQTALNTVFTTNNVNPTMGAAKTVNSLWIDNPGVGKFVDLGTGAFNLTLGSGRILLTGTNDFEIKRSGSGTLTGTPTYLYLGVDDSDTTLALSVPTAKSIEKDGAGTLILNAANTFTAMQINGGTVKYGDSGDLAVTTLTTMNGGIFDLTGKTDTIGAVTLYSGGISNSVAGGALTIGALAFGTTAIGSGPVGSVAFIDTGTGTLRLGSTVTYNVINDPRTAVISGNLDLNGATRSFVVGDSVAPDAYVDLDVPAVITGAPTFGIAKTGTGTMRLGGNNTFDGPVTAVGTLRLNHPMALGKPSAARVLTLSALSSLVLDGSNGDIAIPANYTPVSLNTANTLVGPINGSLVNWSGNNSISGAVTIAAATQIASLKAGDKLKLTGAMAGNLALTVNGDGDTELSGVRSGTTAATLVKLGSGTLTLSGAGANTFAGPTTVSGGKLVLAKTGGVAALVDGAVGINNGGTLRYAAGTTNQMGAPIVTINGSGSLDFNGATDTIGNLFIVANAALSPATSDTTAITNSAGGGNLTIGALSVTPAPGFLSRIDTGSGTLRLGGNVVTVLAATGRTQISGKLDLGAATRTFTPVATTYPFYDMDIDAVVSGGAGVGLTSATGRLRLSGANTYPGDTTISSGTLRLGNLEAIPHGAGKGNLVATAGILDLNGFSPTINGLTGAGTVDNLAVGGNCTLYVGDDNRTSTYKGIIKNTVGTVALCKIGTGTLELTGNSTLFTGGTTISNGTVLATISANALGTGVSTVKLAGGNLALTNNAATAFGRPVSVLANGAIITDLGVPGVGVTHTLGTLAIGSQTLGVRSGLKTTSGIAGLTFGATTLSGSPTIAITDPVNGGTTKLTLGAITDNGNFLTLAGNGDFAQSAVWPAGTGGLILGDAFSGSATLGYANLFTGGVAISNGLAVLGVATGLGPAGNAVVTFGSATTNGVLRVNGFGPTIAGLNSLSRNAIVENGHAATAVTLTINNAADCSYAGLLQNGGAAALALTKSGVGTLTLSGTNTYTGLTTVNVGGVLDIQNDQGLGSAVAGTTVASGSALQLQGGIAVGAEALTLSGTGVAGSGALRNLSGTNSYGGLITLALANTRINSDAGLLTLDVASGNAIAGAFNVVFGGEGDITVADPIATGAFTLTKDGNCTLTLSGVNTFTGATTVNGGTLRVATTNALIASASVTVAPGGTLEPGAFGAAGSTTYVKALTLGTGSIVKFEFAEGGNDKVNVTGATASSLTLNGGGILLYAQGTTDPWTKGGRYDLFKYNSTLGGSVANLSVLNPQPNMVYTFVAAGGWVSLIVADPTLAHIWDGGSLADSNWMTAENWSDDVTPDPVSVLTFAGTTHLAITNNYAANTSFSGLLFDATAGAFTLDGNVVNLLGNVTNSSPNAQTINLPLLLDMASRTFSTEAGDIAIGGTIGETAGGLGLVKRGTSMLTLAGANTFSGATDIQSGVLNVRNSTGLGTVAGGVTVADGATLQVQDGIAIGAEAMSLNGMGVASNGSLRNISGLNSYAGLITLASDARINSDGGTLRLDPAAGNAIAGTGRAVTFGGAGDTVVADPIATGTDGALTKDGSGTLTLSAANTFTGPTRLEAGKIRATSVVGALGGAGQLQIAGGILEIANDAALALSKNVVTISGNSALVADRLGGSGAGVVPTFGTLAIGDQNVTVSGGSLVTSGLAGITFGATTLSGSPTFSIFDPVNGGTTKLTLGAIGGSDNFISLAGNGDFTVSGIWGAGAGGIVLGSSFSGVATLIGANAYTGGSTIKAGTLAGTVASAFGTPASPITLGNTFGNANATLMGSGAVTFAQPITVVAGNTGKAFITSGANATFSGPVNMDNHDLSLYNTTAGTLTLSGGISGTGNILLDIQGNRTITISTLPVNPVGAIVNVGGGTGAATISGGVGTNVTAITESSTNSALTISTGALLVNANGTTLANDNPSGIRVLTVLSAVNGVGDLFLRNNSAIANGVTVSGSPNHSGVIINSGTGTGNTLLSGILGANVAGVFQNSPTSMLSMSGNSSAYTNGVTINAGAVSGATSVNCFGTGAGMITLGNTSGFADAILIGGTTINRPIFVTGGNSGAAVITNSYTAIFSGAVTMNSHDLRISSSTYNLTMNGGFSGAGNISVQANGAGLLTLSAKPVNNAGTIISSGTGSGAVTISGGVGSNVTAIVQNATNSTLTVGTVALTVNENGTTLANNNINGAKPLTLSGPVNGSGDLILRNNSAIVNGITVSGAPNHKGQLINAGTGSGNTLISGIIGPNVTNVVQASETSVLTLSGANTFPFGVAVASNMTVRIANVTGSATGTGVVSIATGGTIDGNGFMSGPVTLAGGATLSPSINGRTAGGRLTLGAMEWHGGGVLDCVVTKIDSALGGTDYGQISVSGAFTGLPGDTNLVIRLDTLGQTLAVNPSKNYGLKLITFETAGMSTNLNLSSVLVDTNAFLVTGGAWSLTNVFNSIYLVNLGLEPETNANVWIAPGYVQSGGSEHLYFDYWSRTNNWSLGHAPLPGEKVVFDFYSQKECWINFITNSIGSLTMTPAYGNTLVFWTGFPGEGFYSNFVVTGDVKVESGNMRHMGHETGGDVEVNRMVLTVGGDFTLGPNGTVNLDGLGYRAGFGPGAGNGLLAAASRSASHGGAGANNLAGKTTHGSITQPEDLGSGAAGPGGGALFMHVGGTATIDGLVSARGTGGSASSCPGAGGSIFIKAGAVAGSGTVRAGANADIPAYYGSGGGRIALIATNGSTIGPLAISANTHPQTLNGGGRAGTVYLETTAFKRLIIDQGNIGSASASFTDLAAPTETFATDPALGGPLEDVTLILTNNAFVRLNQDLRMGDLSWLNGELSLESHTLYLKAATPAGTFPDDYGAGTVTLPGVFFTFANGESITRDGRILWGDPTTSWRVITMVHDDIGGTATNKGEVNEGYFEHGSSLEFEATPTDLAFRFWDGTIPEEKPSTTANPLIIPSLAGSTVFRAWFADPIVNQTYLEWLPSAGSDDWFAPYNWDLLMVPVAGQIVTIPAGSTVRINDATPVLGSLTLAAGSTLTFEGWNSSLEATTMTINGTVTHLPQTVTEPNELGEWVPQHRIWLKGQNLLLASTGILNADGKGYKPGAGPGAAPAQTGDGDDGTGYNCGGGGGYGGSGAAIQSQLRGEAYGEPDDPWQPGSGGGYRPAYFGQNAKPAGGAIRIDMTGQVTLDGIASARGTDPVGQGTAGSGGGIALYCQTLTGATSGWVRVDGGKGYPSGGSGGGGRIALHYNPAAQAALPDPRPPIRFSAAAGYILNPAASQTTVLPVMGTLYMPDTTLLAVSPTGPAVLDNQRFWHTRLYVASHPESWSPASLLIENCWVGFPENYTLQVGGNLTLSGTQAPLSGVERAGLHLFATNSANLYGSQLRVDGNFTILTNTWFYPHTDGHSAAFVGTRVGGSFTVAAGGGVNADMDGYIAMNDNSNGPGAGVVSHAGGSYGGWGGVTNTASGVTNGVARPPYGDAALPLDPGSPGAWSGYGNYTPAGRGGGVIHVLAGGRMVIDGTLTANGGNGVYAGGSGGSGGTIFLTTSGRLIGGGTLQARGGSVDSRYVTTRHPGGGGRIAVWQILSLNAAETRVANHNVARLTKEDTLPAFHGVVNVLEGPIAGHGATAGTAEFYMSRLNVLILR